ncbi:MAG: restriction endonuclease subunit S [Rubrivivax sp.]|nr:restriction endonuclease subunit S [Rubrivivax sp.]
MEVREPSPQYLTDGAAASAPTGWVSTGIGQLGAVVTGSTPSTANPANYGDDFPFVGPGDLSYGKWVARTEKSLSITGFARARPLPPGAVLFVCIGSTIGKCAVAATRLATNQQINAIVPSTEFVGEFVYYAVAAVASRVRALAGEQAVPIVNKGQFASTTIVVPKDRGEQEEIARTLSDADALIESLEQLLAKKRQLKQGAMQELLTGKNRLPGFGGAWTTRTLGEMFAFSGGLSASREQLSAEGIAYLHYGDIHLGTSTLLDLDAQHASVPKLDVPASEVPRKAWLDDGDVVFVDASEDDEGTSKHVVVRNVLARPFVAGLHTIVAKAKGADLDKEFRRYCFQSAAVKAQFKFFAVGTKVSGVSKGNIGKITLAFPSIEEQSAIATVLSALDTELEALEARLAKARALKQGMAQALLTGRIRLAPFGEQPSAAPPG